MMAEESEVQPVNKTYNTIEPQVRWMICWGWNARAILDVLNILDMPDSIGEQEMLLLLLLLLLESKSTYSFAFRLSQNAFHEGFSTSQMG